ncbi:MAG: ArnT family glycosyltransferase [Opitutales bacterium]
MLSAPTRPSHGLLLLTAACALVAVTLWLRAPAFGFKSWNVDEAIHAAAARTLLDGGVLYRDAIDQRTPLSYCVMAAIFALAGENNFLAVHLCTALLIAATALLLLLAGRRMAGPATGAWAALLYIVLSTGLLYPGDANAYATEWFVAFFTSAAAWLFWTAPEDGPGPVRLSLTGAMFALAFLSKQPGALDLAAPALTLAYLAWRTSSSIRRISGWRWTGLALGFAVPPGLVLCYYAWRGALPDFIFYTWTYNLRYYGPEINPAERLASAGVPFRLLAAFSPLLLITLVAATLAALYHLLQRQPTAEENRANPARFYLLVWGVSALAGAASGGRGYDHYSIQFLPPLCLGAAWLLGHLTVFVLHRPGRAVARTVAAVILVLLSAGLITGTLAARRRTLPVDPSLRIARYISERSSPAERIFIWGYQPDVYLFSDRRPASRFIYASFLTGLIPWSNCDPGRDTTYAIVPGAMDTLLRELATNRPVFIVDCSAGPNRHWDKYPLEKFPPLAAFIQAHYLVVEPARFIPQGFRLFAIKDEFRPGPVALPPVAAAPARPGAIGIHAPHLLEAKTSRVNVSADDPAGRLRHLELRLDGELVDAVTVQPGPGLSVDFEVPFDRHQGSHRLTARAVCADGAVFDSAAHLTETQPVARTGMELASFAVPVYRELVLPTEIYAPYGATAGMEEGHMVYFAHAPSHLRYQLPAGIRAVHGGFGFRPGAYAADNKSPTDGAEFRVDWLTPDGLRQTLFHRLLRPGPNPADRGGVPFRLELPAGASGRLDFVIDPGPAGDATSDWTYWTDLAFETSR